jgi:hypothetical protein
MGWLCPTFQRPEKLQNLAKSWDATATDIPLKVRIWSKDPRKEDYRALEWPASWSFYESDAEWAGDALAEYFEAFPNEEYYGFIGDDIVLLTPGGIEQLIYEAGEWFVAYPNDMLQRHHMATHFCIGGELVRTLGYIVPPGFTHHYMDQAIMDVATNVGLLRYRPDILFFHDHFIRNVDPEKYDATYARVYTPEGKLRHDEKEEAKFRLNIWHEREAPFDISRVRRRMLEVFEGLTLDEEAAKAVSKMGPVNVENCE